MTYPVVITPSAQDDLREAYTFTLLASNEKAVKEKMEALFAKIFFLGKNSHFLVASSYLIFYSFDEKQISLLALTRQKGE
jgi:hypothetical protein